MSVTQIHGANQIQAVTITNAQIAAAAGIVTSKLADGANFILRGGTIPFTADQSMGTFKLTNLANGVAATDAVNRGQLDAAVNGLTWKAAVRVATTAAGTLATSFENGDTIDGVVLATGDRILVKNQAAGAENGLYTVNASGAPTRATDADTSAEVTSGLSVFVSEGTVNADTQWSLTTNDPIALGTTALAFAQIGGSTTYTGSNGIDVTGSVISPTYGSTANTICQGNDARLSDARSPVGTALASASIWVGSAGNVAAAVAVTGDVSITSGGVTAIGAAKVTNAMLAGSIAASKLVGTDIVTVGTITTGIWNGTTIAVANGGTGAATLTANAVLLGNGTGAVAFATIGTAGRVLIDQGAGSPPAFTALSGDATITSAGVVTVANQLKLANTITRETPAGTINGSNVTFTLANAPIAGTEHVYLNGILQDSGAGNDYTIAAAVITMLSAPVSGDKIRASYIK